MIIGAISIGTLITIGGCLLMSRGFGQGMFEGGTGIFVLGILFFLLGIGLVTYGVILC